MGGQFILSRGFKGGVACFFASGMDRRLGWPSHFHRAAVPKGACLPCSRLFCPSAICIWAALLQARIYNMPLCSSYILQVDLWRFWSRSRACERARRPNPRATRCGGRGSWSHILLRAPPNTRIQTLDTALTNSKFALRRSSSCSLINQLLERRRLRR